MKAHQKRFLLLLMMLLICLNVSSMSGQSVSGKPVAKPKTARPSAKLPVAAQQIEDQQAAATVEQLLAKAGQKYQRLGVGVWAIRKNGPNFKYFQMVLSYRAGTVVTEVTVAKANSVRVNEVAPALLRLANRLDYAKVGVDTGGDVFVRNEARLKSLDVDGLTHNIDKVAAAADQVYVEISSK